MDNKIVFVVVLLRLSPPPFNNPPCLFSEKKKKKTSDGDLFHTRSVSMETMPRTSMLVGFLSSASQIWSTCDPNHILSFFLLFHISTLRASSFARMQKLQIYIHHSHCFYIILILTRFTFSINSLVYSKLIIHKRICFWISIYLFDIHTIALHIIDKIPFLILNFFGILKKNPNIFVYFDSSIKRDDSGPQINCRSSQSFVSSDN